MPLLSFAQLYQEADARRPGVPVVAAGAADRTVLEALRAACDRGWGAPVLAGRGATTPGYPPGGEAGAWTPVARPPRAACRSTGSRSTIARIRPRRPWPK